MFPFRVRSEDTKVNPYPLSFMFQKVFNFFFNKRKYDSIVIFVG